MGRKRTKPISKGPKESLLQRIRQNPGLGYKSIDQPLLEELESEGAIFQHRFPWSETVFWYESGYPVDKLFQPDQRQAHRIKRYIDPTYKGSWQPDDALPATIADRALTAFALNTVPKAMQPNINPYTGERKAMSTPETPQDDIDRYRQKEAKASDDSRNPNLSKILSAIAAAEKQAIADGTYKLPTRNELSLRVDLKNYFYTSTAAGEAAQQAYTKAQERLLEALQAKKATSALQPMSEAEAESAIDAVRAELDAYDRDKEARGVEAAETQTDQTDESLNNAGRTALEEAQWQAKMSAKCVVELVAEKDQLEQRLQALGDRLDKFEQSEQRLQEAEQRNYELRQQIADLQKQKQQPQFVEIAVPANHYKQQSEAWQETVAELEVELAHARATRDAFAHLASINVVSQPVDFAKLNGHFNGNGKAIAPGATHET